MGHFISFTVTFGGFKVNKIIAVRDICPVHQNIVPVLHAGLVDPLLAVVLELVKEDAFRRLRTKEMLQ